MSPMRPPHSFSLGEVTIKYTEVADLMVTLPLAKLHELHEQARLGDVELFDHPFESNVAFMALVGASRLAGKDVHGVDRFTSAIIAAIETGVGRIDRPRRPQHEHDEHERDAETNYYLLVIRRDGYATTSVGATSSNTLAPSCDGVPATMSAPLEVS